MRSRGILIFVVLAVAGSLALGGCTATGTSTGSADWQALGQSVVTQSPDPNSGQQPSACSTFASPHYAQDPLLPIGSAVLCTQPYQAFTFQSISLEGGASTPPAGTTEADLDQQAISQCSQAFAVAFPQAASNQNSRVELGVEVEPQSSWGVGALWAHCDTVELQVGTALTTPAFATIQQVPNTFLGTVKATPGAYQICVNTHVADTSNGPMLDGSATLADCASAQWKLEPSPNFPNPQGQAYPGYDSLESSWMHAHCGALYDTATVRGWVFYRSSTQWAAGSRSFECWVGKR